MQYQVLQCNTNILHIMWIYSKRNPSNFDQNIGRLWEKVAFGIQKL